MERGRSVLLDQTTTLFMLIVGRGFYENGVCTVWLEPFGDMRPLEVGRDRGQFDRRRSAPGQGPSPPVAVHDRGSNGASAGTGSFGGSKLGMVVVVEVVGSTVDVVSLRSLR